ncbi:glycosyltransferase [Marinobacter daepoensis]|uniref:glycosyltransferase n=1 Tax=Marinobacter daepoensis TaxID=262077 RepID=UPI001C962A5A|nr:glycosyltransferase [Marinobacter daepoensis]MBY6032524.1 glycosyltransferase [Marinobacter daepoensis]
MRLTHFTASNGLFGAERAIIELADAQQKAGQDVSVVSLDVGSGSLVFERELDKRGIEYISIPCRKRINIHQFLSINKVLNDIDPDVVHCHNYKSNFYVALCLMKNKKIKKIATLHGYLLPKLFTLLRFYYFIDRKILRSFDKIVLVSDKIKKRLPRRIAMSENISVIYNGISTDFLESNECNNEYSCLLKDDGVKFICVGRLSSEKNYMEAIYLFSLIEKKLSKSTLCIVGEGPEEYKLKKLVNELNLDTKVFFTGYVNDASTLIGESDCLLITSLSEGLPMTLLEAMRHFTLVAYRDVGEIDNVLLNGELGFRIDKKLAFCAEDLLAILMDPTKLTIMKKRANKRLEEEFSSKAMEQSYRKLYESMWS